MTRRALYLLPLLLFALVAGYFLWGLASDRNPNLVPSALIDKPAPAFDLPPLAGLGRPGLATADLQNGGVALVNFFASWCLPCRAEHPLLMDLAESGVVRVLGIDFRDSPEDARRWLEDGVLSLVSPLDSQHRAEAEITDEQQTWLEWMVANNVERVRLET